MVKPIQTVGFIGMGIMGRPMAQNLIKSGFEVTVWNRTLAKCDPLHECGAAVACSPADLAARNPQVICTNITDTCDVEQVLFGDDGVASKAQTGLILVDHSTISPVQTIRFAASLAELGVTLLDAPVSGGDVGAKAGTLSIMVGGPQAIFDRCQSLFEAVGEKIVYVGDSGMGQVCKACNQIAVACNLMGVCEALALAKRNGLDLSRMIEVVGGGAGGSWQLANLGPRIAVRDHDPGFMIDLVLKDLAIIADTCRENQLPLAGTVTAEAYFRAVAAAGGGKLGTQGMARALEQLGAFQF